MMHGTHNVKSKEKNQLAKKIVGFSFKVQEKRIRAMEEVGGFI